MFNVGNHKMSTEKIRKSKLRMKSKRQFFESAAKDLNELAKLSKRQLPAFMASRNFTDVRASTWEKLDPVYDWMEGMGLQEDCERLDDNCEDCVSLR
jgi:hypothetical protein